MTDTKPASQQSPPKSKDFGQGQVQKEFSELDKQGFLGVQVDPIPNREYSLESGPDSPSAVEQLAALAKKEAESA